MAILTLSIISTFTESNFCNIVTNSTASILSILLSGFIASIAATYYTNIYKEHTKAIETANYAKLLAYECAMNAKNYNIIAENIKNVKSDISLIQGDNLTKRWAQILEYDFTKDEHNQICYAMLAVLLEKDIEFWNKNKDKFIHLEPYYFELMHKYFTQTRPSCKIVYTASNLAQTNFYISYSQKCANYSEIINLYLSYLINEASRSYIGYIFKSFFVNKYAEPLKRKLDEAEKI